MPPPEFELWLDNQLPSIIAKRIQDEFGFTAKSCFALHAQEWSDWQIYSAAKKQSGLVIILSKDGDFPKIIEQHGTPPKVIKINTGNIRNKALWELLQPLLPEAIRILTTTDTETIYIQSQETF